MKDYYLNNVYKIIDLNCAESVLFTADKFYKMGLSDESFRLASAFGGGMYIEGKCGALTGALMVIGYLFVKENAHASEHLKTIVKSFFNEFEIAMGSCECAPLKVSHRSEMHGCRSVIASALEVLEKTVNSFSDLKVR